MLFTRVADSSLFGDKPNVTTLLDHDSKTVVDFSQNEQQTNCDRNIKQRFGCFKYATD